MFLWALEWLGAQTQSALISTYYAAQGERLLSGVSKLRIRSALLYAAGTSAPLPHSQSERLAREGGDATLHAGAQLVQHGTTKAMGASQACLGV